MFNFGTKITKRKEVNELDTQMALTMVANPEMKGARRFLLSQLAYDTLGFHTNENGPDQPPSIINEVISFGNVVDGLGAIQNYSFFVNNAGVGGLKEINVGKTTQGFNDSVIYKKLAELHNLDTSVDNIFDIVRSTTTDEVEAEHNIEIYNLIPRTLTATDTEVVTETVQEEGPGEDSIESVELNDNSDVDVTLEN